MKTQILLSLLLIVPFMGFSQQSALDETVRYSYLGNFNSVSSSQETATGQVFDEIDIIINYTVLENVDGGRIFKDVSVYSTDICDNCKLDVEFSEKQFHEEDVLDSMASVFLTFSLLKENKNQVKISEEVKAKLTADGNFSIRKDER